MTSIVSGETLSPEKLAAAPPERLLALLAGGAAIGFGTLAFALDVAHDPRVELLGLKGAAAAIMTFLVTLLFGALLLYVAMRMEARPRDLSVLVVAFSVVLLALGGVGGAIAGILGLFSGAVVLVRELRARPSAA